MDLFGKKKKEVPLSPEVAEQMLSNVFAACEYEGNRVPLETLLSYSNYRRERHLLQKVVIVAVLIAFLLLPVLFVTADLELSMAVNTKPGSPVIELVPKSFLPIDSITATMDGFALDVYQVEEGVYQIYPDRNGTLVITVTLVNKQYSQAQLQIESVDVSSPQLVSSRLDNGELEIFLSDDSGELDYEGIYAVDSNGNKVYPLRYSEEKMSVTFAYPDDFLNIFVSDKYNNTLQLVLTVR